MSTKRSAAAIVAIVIGVCCLTASPMLPLRASPALAGPQTGGPAITATVYSRISYQGVLTDASGVPLNGSFNLIFQLWNDASAGSQVGNNIEMNGVVLSNGLLMADLDIPQSIFNGQALWLRIAVNGQWLAPRQALLPVPYALSLRPGASIQGALTTTVLAITNTGLGPALRGVGAMRGVEGSGLIGVYGEMSFVAGVMGQDTTTGNMGELGTSSYAVGGVGNGSSTGVYGSSSSGYGVSASSESGTALRAETMSGIAASARYTGNGNEGQLGTATSGVYGNGVAGTGVLGIGAGSNAGVWGKSSTGSGLVGTNLSTGNYVNIAGSDEALHAVAWSGRGARVQAPSGDAVTGQSDTGNGVVAETSSAQKSALIATNHAGGAAVTSVGDLVVTGAYRGNIGPNNGAPFARPALDTGWHYIVPGQCTYYDTGMTYSSFSMENSVVQLDARYYADHGMVIQADGCTWALVCSQSFNT